MIFDTDPEDDAIDEAFSFLEPKEWMQEVDKVVDAYKHEVDMLRTETKAAMNKFKRMEKRLDSIEADIVPIKALMKAPVASK